VAQHRGAGQLLEAFWGTPNNELIDSMCRCLLDFESRLAEFLRLGLAEISPSPDRIRIHSFMFRSRARLSAVRAVVAERSAGRNFRYRGGVH
jgi:hypothetical protein